MKVLFTNHTLSMRGGTELYVRDIALALRKAGHVPWCYSQRLGSVTTELRREGIEVFDALAEIPGEPDLIHGHHALESTTAGLFFPSAPIVSFCHGPKGWQEKPCHLPNVALWVAVDLACRARLIDEEGIPADRIELLLSFVDTDRFVQRDPLPARPRRALALSNAAAEDTYLPLLREVCRRLDMTLDVAGKASGNRVQNVDRLLLDCDLVFAKGRSALEAMAVGCAVVQCDWFGAGRMVTTRNYDELRPQSFGFPSMNWPLTADHLTVEVAAYDPADARLVSDRVRAEASLAVAFPRLLDIYARALAWMTPARAASARDGARFLETRLDMLKLGHHRGDKKLGASEGGIAAED